MEVSKLIMLFVALLATQLILTNSVNKAIEGLIANSSRNEFENQMAGDGNWLKNERGFSSEIKELAGKIKIALEHQREKLHETLKQLDATISMMDLTLKEPVERNGPNWKTASRLTNLIYEYQTFLPKMIMLYYAVILIIVLTTDEFWGPIDEEREEEHMLVQESTEPNTPTTLPQEPELDNSLILCEPSHDQEDLEEQMLEVESDRPDTPNTLPPQEFDVDVTVQNYHDVSSESIEEISEEDEDWVLINNPSAHKYVPTVMDLSVD